MRSIRNHDSEIYPDGENDHFDRISDFLLSMHENQKGNLVCEYDGRLLTIFTNRRGKYQWSIYDYENVHYAPQNYENQEDAAAALLDALDEEGA